LRRPAACRARASSASYARSADTALRLGKFFGTTGGFWLNLQRRYDLEVAERAIAKELEAIETYKQEAA
jgi:plasmid maintenance system antidote protein VapI